MILVADIQRKVARSYRIPSCEMVSPRRARDVVYPRQVAMYLSKRLTRHSLSRLGDFFGGRDHATVIYGVRSVERRMQDDPLLRRRVRRLERRVGT